MEGPKRNQKKEVRKDREGREQAKESTNRKGGLQQKEGGTHAARVGGSQKEGRRWKD